MQGCTCLWFRTVGNCSGQKLLRPVTQEQVFLFTRLIPASRELPPAPDPLYSFSASLGLGATYLPLGDGPTDFEFKGYLGASSSREAMRTGHA